MRIRSDRVLPSRAGEGTFYIAPGPALRISVSLTMADSGEGSPSRPPGGGSRTLKRKSEASSAVSPTRLQTARLIEQAELVRFNLLEWMICSTQEQALALSMAEHLRRSMNQEPRQVKIREFLRSLY